MQHAEDHSLHMEDVQRLLKNPCAETKAEVTEKLAESYSANELNDMQMQLAEEIFRTLVKDTEVKVRQTLSEHIKEAEHLPHDVALTLAKDIEEVALPVLEFSDVLTDEDLVDIITHTEDVSKQKAITKRETLSGAVSEALIETHNDEVVDSLLHNVGAQITESGYTKVVDYFPDKENIISSMVERGSLPVAVVERMATAVSDHIFQKVSSRHKGIFDDISDVVWQSREIATMKLMGLKSTGDEFRKLIDKLRSSGKLTPISALCMGNLSLFEITMSRLTRLPVDNVKKLTHDKANKGFEALYTKAELPPNLLEATEVVVQILRGIEKEVGETGAVVKVEVSNRLIEKVMQRVEDGPEVENLAYMLTLIKQNVKNMPANAGTDQKAS